VASTGAVAASGAASPIGSPSQSGGGEHAASTSKAVAARAAPAPRVRWPSLSILRRLLKNKKARPSQKGRARATATDVRTAMARHARSGVGPAPLPRGGELRERTRPVSWLEAASLAFPPGEIVPGQWQWRRSFSARAGRSGGVVSRRAGPLTVAGPRRIFTGFRIDPVRAMLGCKLPPFSGLDKCLACRSGRVPRWPGAGWPDPPSGPRGAPPTDTGVAAHENPDREPSVSVVTFLAGAAVLLAALYLLGFGALAVVVPARASGFLLGFGGSPRAHWIELFARAAVGAALVGYAAHMRFAGVFHVFGWVLLVTTFALAVLPWRLHRRFARTTVPVAANFLPWIGIASLAAGAFVLWALASARAA